MYVQHYDNNQVLRVTAQVVFSGCIKSINK